MDDESMIYVVERAGTVFFFISRPTNLLHKRYQKLLFIIVNDHKYYIFMRTIKKKRNTYYIQNRIASFINQFEEKIHKYSQVGASFFALHDSLDIDYDATMIVQTILKSN